jgi:hypothetical protein
VKINQVTKNRGTMKKFLKRLGIAFAIVFVIVFANGCYFVFDGQFKVAEKIKNKQELNLYEISSIYTMHLAICTAGLVYSPEASKEVFAMSFKKNRDTEKYVENDFFLESPKVRQALQNLKPGVEKRIAFTDSCYSLFDPNHTVALAVNPGFLKIEGDRLTLRAPIHYPTYSLTKIYITKTKYILIHESLFNYLEMTGVLHPYTIIYYTDYPLEK